MKRSPWSWMVLVPLGLWMSCSSEGGGSSGHTDPCFNMEKCPRPDAGVGGDETVTCPPAPASGAIAPTGWQRWSFTPPDCAIFVPDDIGSVVPITWEACPFMLEGCTLAGAPWAAASGWGYGPRIQVGSRGRSTYLRVGRRLADTFAAGFEHWWESLVLEGDAIVQVRAFDTGQSQCSISEAIELGMATSLVARHGGCPLYFEEPIDSVGDDDPGDLIEFHKNPGLIGSGRAFVTGSWRVFEELAPDKCFVAVNRKTGQRCRPCASGSVGEILHLDAHGGVAHYTGWTGALQSAWVHEPCGEAKPLLKDDTASYEHITSDGSDYVWVKASGFRGQTGLFDAYELWTAPFVSDPAELRPRKVRDLDLPAVLSDLLSVGEGWVAVRHSGFQDIRLFRLSDGAEKRLPVVDGVAYNGGRDSLVIHRGRVWVAAFPLGGAGNDVRWIIRFDLAALPWVE